MRRRVPHNLFFDSNYPQFAGAVVGNTIIVVAYGCVRTLLRLGLRSASSSHFFCSHLMELVDTTNVATIWPVFTFLLSPTMSVCVALLSLYSSAVSLSTGVVGILLAGEFICVLFFRPYSTLIDTITVLVVNILFGASQIVSLMSTTGEGSAVSTALGLIASVFQLVVAIGLGLDGVGRFFEGGGLYRGVWIEDQTTQAQKVTNLSNMEVRNDTPMVHERSNHYLMQPPCDEKDIQKRQNRVVDAAALAHLSTIIATICDVQYALNA